MPTSKTIRIMGIDPGIERTGVGVIDVTRNQPVLVHVECITTPRTQTHDERLKNLSDQLSARIQELQPDAAAVEKLFFSQNVKTAMSVSEARGVILLALKQAGIPTTEWTPQQVKQHVTGYGNADKKQVQLLVKAILRLKEVPQPDDAADALAVALTAQQTTL